MQPPIWSRDIPNTRSGGWLRLPCLCGGLQYVTMLSPRLYLNTATLTAEAVS